MLTLRRELLALSRLLAEIARDSYGDLTPAHILKILPIIASLHRVVLEAQARVLDRRG